MMALLEPRASWSLRGTLTRTGRGRHRRGLSLTTEDVLIAVVYVAMWATFSAYATLVAVR